MRGLFDERLRHLFDEHDCQTARFAGFAGLKNGALLLAAEAREFQVSVTVDQHIPDQQSFESRQISLLILRGRTNRLSDLQSLVPAALNVRTSIRPGQVVSISG